MDDVRSKEGGILLISVVFEDACIIVIFVRCECSLFICWMLLIKTVFKLGKPNLEVLYMVTEYYLISLFLLVLNLLASCIQESRDISERFSETVIGCMLSHNSFDYILNNG